MTPAASGTNSLQQVFDLQQAAFRRDMTPTLAERRDRLHRLLAMTRRHGPTIVEAISADFGHRSAHETLLTDLFTVEAGIKHATRHLAGWMKTRRLPTALHFRPAYNRLIRQPLGVVGIVAPWNYPFQLAVAPATGALAAGNRVMIKPSELTPRFADLLARIIGETFAEDEVAVINGDAEVAKAFVELPFAHLLFTGSTAVGRRVAQAAARNLTPVTLELGGKSPALIDTSADMTLVAGRLAFAKLLNAGQTCVAPDYALVPAGREDELVAALRSAVSAMYPRLQANPDYTSIVSERHFARLAGLVADARSKGAHIIEINPAGENTDPRGRKFLPTLVLGATEDMRIMQEELFGPILPVIPYAHLDEAIAAIGRRDRPLALYWFGQDRANRERVLTRTISGGVTVNDCIWHLAQEDAPFGGVGPSGSGAYHGEYGFRTFSKEKPVFFQSRLNGLALLRPPYGPVFKAITAVLRRMI